MPRDSGLADNRFRPPKGNPLNLARADGTECPNCKQGTLVLHPGDRNTTGRFYTDAFRKASLTCTRCVYEFHGIMFDPIPDKPQF